MRQLRRSDINSDPFKSQRSPLRDVSFFEGNPELIRIDPAHTFAIDGVGKCYYASSIVLLLLAGHFGHGTTDRSFGIAYSRFVAFCKAHKKHTSIQEFSHKTLKLPIGSFPVCTYG